MPIIKQKQYLLDLLLDIDNAKADIKNLCEQRIELLEVKQNLSGIDYSRLKTNSSGSVSDLSVAIIRLEEIDEKLSKKINHYCSRLCKAEYIMSKIKDKKACLYVTKKYRLKKSVRKISEEEKVSQSTVKRKLKKALNL